MKRTIKVSDNLHKNVFIVSVIIFGVILRLAAASFGYTYDMESYAIVGKIVATGGNVYAATTRYNYGPIWMYIVGFVYKFSLLLPYSFIFFRFGLAFILSVADVGIFILLFREYSLVVGLSYFLNPLSIVLSGYGSQFENIAILTALVGAILFRKNEKASVRSQIGSLIFLGISLVIKHIYFAFPLWLAMRQKTWQRRIIVFSVPLLIFGLSFLPYIAGGLQGIIKNVFLYASFHNAPLWNLIIPDVFKRYITPQVLFFGSLVAIGWLVRKKTVMEAFLWYGMVLVTFSLAISDQYFTIVLPMIAVSPNVFFLLAVVAHFFHMLIVINGGELYSRLFNMTFDKHTIAYSFQTGFLFAGIFYLFSKKKVRELNIRQWSLVLFILNLSLVMFVFLPGYREDKTVSGIQRALDRGDYEEANALYNKTQINPPFAGSRFWNKLAKPRYFVEYYRKYRQAADIYDSKKEKSDWVAIFDLLKHEPLGFVYGDSVRKMILDAQSHIHQL